MKAHSKGNRFWRIISAVGLFISLVSGPSCGERPSNPQQDRASQTTDSQAEQSDSETPTPATASANEDPAAPVETLDDRLGASDGFAASIFYVSDLTGSLDVCGCAQNPQGGVARQKGFLNEFERRYHQVPYLFVDLGHSLSERAKFGTTDLFESVRVGNEWVIRAYDALSVAAVNVSFRDLLQLNHTFANDMYEKQNQQYPILERFVSANVRARGDTHMSPQPYLIRTLRGGRLKRPLKVGLVGLTEVGTLPLENFQIDDPLETAQRIIPEVRAMSDMVVVMGYLSRPVAQRLASSGLPWDALLTAYRFPQVQPVRRFGKKLWATSIYEGRFLGELRIYLDEQGWLANLTNRYVPLDKVVPDDPKFALIRDRAREAMEAAETE